MKKIGLLAIVSVFALSCQTEKTGYVDTEELLTEYAELKEAKERFTKQNDEIMADLQLKIDAFEIKGKQFQANASSMSRQKQEEKYNELALENQQLQNEQRTKVGQLQAESQKVIDSIIKKVKTKVKTYGQENGYGYIYGANDAGSVLYGKDELNLTQKVLSELNKDYKSDED